ncbi:MAG: hypothetical protein M3R15_16190 [Acidobacteriota bacterium]|nr:hypothetical protein [Burkholderiales bacterium]MDQ3255412.1 hypothetical protein [Acidobacteriota bacterium]
MKSITLTAIAGQCEINLVSPHGLGVPAFHPGKTAHEAGREAVESSSFEKLAYY